MIRCQRCEGPLVQPRRRAGELVCGDCATELERESEQDVLVYASAPLGER